MDPIPEPTRTFNPFMFLDSIKKAWRILEAWRLAKGTGGIKVDVSENGVVIDGSGAGDGTSEIRVLGAIAGVPTYLLVRGKTDGTP